MLEDIKNKWVAALRSDEYKQGVEYLCADGEYCCLGVLYEVAGYEWHPNHFGIKGVESSLSDGAKYIETQELPAEIMQEIGIDQEDCNILIQMNDDEGKDFNQIADYIEENL